MAEELALATVQETPDAALALVEAAGHRTQLHKRALRMLGSLQEDLGSLLDELSTSHPELLASAAATSAQQVAVRQAPGALVVSKKTSLHNIQALAQALGLPLPENKQAQELMVATQQRTDMVEQTCVSFDDLCNSMEGFLADLLDAAGKQAAEPSQQAASTTGQAGDGQAKNDTSTCTDVMREAAATCAAAQRWQQRANDAQQAASTAQQQAWQKATEAATASAQATQAEHEAELLRVQGKLPEAMQAIRTANRLRLESETAMKESEALQTEHQARLSEALEASHQALQVSQRAAQLEQLGLQIEAEQAENEAARYQSDYEQLLHRAQAARQAADGQTANSQQLLLQVAEMQSAAIAAYAAGDVETGSRLNAEATQLQVAAQAAMQDASQAQQQADSLLSQAEQMSAQAGSASSQAQALQGSRFRLQSVAAQRDAARLQQQAAHALGASQQAEAEAEELQQLQEQYQRSSEEALARAKQLEQEGRPQEAAVERAAAQSWAQLSHVVADKADVARQEAAHKAGVGASLQRAADLAATGAADNADTTEASASALEALLDPRQRQQSAHEAMKELIQAMQQKEGSLAGGSQLGRRGSSGGSSAKDAEQLAAETEEAQQRAARLNKQLMLAAQHLAQRGDLLGPEHSSSTGTGHTSTGRSNQAIEVMPESSDAALDGVAVSHMAQVVRLSRLGSMWKERALQAQTTAAELRSEAESLEAEAAKKEEAAAQLDSQSHWAEQSGDASVAADLAARAHSERSAAAQLRNRQESVRERANNSASEAQVAWEHAKTLARSIQALDEASESFMSAIQPAGSIPLPLLPRSSNASQQLSGLSSAVLSRNTSVASRYGAASTTSTKDGMSQPIVGTAMAGSTQEVASAAAPGVAPASGNASEAGATGSAPLSRVSTLRGALSEEQDPMYLSFSQLPDLDQLKPPVLRLPDTISEEVDASAQIMAGGISQHQGTEGAAGMLAGSRQQSFRAPNAQQSFAERQQSLQRPAGRSGSPFDNWQDPGNAEVDGGPIASGIPDSSTAAFARDGVIRQHSLGAARSSSLGQAPAGLNRAASARAASTMFSIDEGLPGGEVDSGTEGGSRAAGNSRIGSFARVSDGSTAADSGGPASGQGRASGQSLQPDNPEHEWSSFSRSVGGQVLPASGQGSRMSLRVSEVGDGAYAGNRDSNAVLSAAAQALQTANSRRYSTQGSTSLQHAAESLGETAAAFERLQSRRYGPQGSTSIVGVAGDDGNWQYDPTVDQQVCMEAMGVDINDPVAVNKAREYLQTAGYDDVIADEQSHMAAMGVDADNPTAVAKARAFLRTVSQIPEAAGLQHSNSRRFTAVGSMYHAAGALGLQQAASRRYGAVGSTLGVPGLEHSISRQYGLVGSTSLEGGVADEQGTLEAMGVNINDQSAVDKAREYLRTASFHDVATNEQSHLNAMGVDVSNPAAVSKARTFLRTMSMSPAAAGLQHSVSRRYGLVGSTSHAGDEADEQSSLEAMGVDTKDSAAVAKAREYLHTASFHDVATNEQGHLQAMGVDFNSPAAVTKARAFLRTMSLSPGAAGLQHSISRRYSPVGSISIAGNAADEQETLEAMGVDTTDAAAVAKARDYLHSASFHDVATNEQGHLQAMGVDVNSPAAVFKARAFLRTMSLAPGAAGLHGSISRSFSLASSASHGNGLADEQSTLEAMGVDLHNPTAVTKAREYLRTASFQNVVGDEQSHLKAMGIDVNSPMAVAKARTFLRAMSQASDRAGLQHSVSRRYGLVGSSSIAPNTAQSGGRLNGTEDATVGLSGADEYDPAADEQTCIAAMGVDKSDPAAVARAHQFLRTMSVASHAPNFELVDAAATDGSLERQLTEMGVNVSDPKAVELARTFLRTVSQMSRTSEQNHNGSSPNAPGVSTAQAPVAAALQRLASRRHTDADGTSHTPSAAAAAALGRLASGRYGAVGSTSQSSEHAGPARQLSRLLSRTPSRLGPSRLGTNSGLEAELARPDVAAMQAAGLGGAESSSSSIRQRDSFAAGSTSASDRSASRQSSIRSTAWRSSHLQDVEGVPMLHGLVNDVHTHDTPCNVATCASFGAWGATAPAGSASPADQATLISVTPGADLAGQAERMSQQRQSGTGSGLLQKISGGRGLLQHSQSARGLSSLADALDSIPQAEPETSAGQTATTTGQAAGGTAGSAVSPGNQRKQGSCSGTADGKLSSPDSEQHVVPAQICNAGREGDQKLSLADRWLAAAITGSTSMSVRSRAAAGSLGPDGASLPPEATAGPLSAAVAAGLAVPAELTAPGTSSALQAEAAAAVAADTAAMQVTQQTAKAVGARLQRAATTLKQLEQQQVGHDEAVGKWEQQAAELSSEAEELRALLKQQQQDAVERGHDPAADEGVAATARQLQVVELALQRATLLSDARAHQAQVISHQMAYVSNMQEHLQQADTNCTQAQTATRAASHAAVTAQKAEAAVQEKQKCVRECEEQVAEAQSQAATARQLATEALAAGNALQAAELQHKAEVMTARAQQLLASLIKLKQEATEAEALAGDVASQRDVLRGRAEHLQALSTLQQQMADAEQHRAHLSQQHADMLASAADLQAEATALRVQQMEGLVSTDRVAAASQGPLKQRAARLLQDSARLWDLVQEASEYEVPALQQLCEQVKDLMAAEEALLLHQQPGKAESHTTAALTSASPSTTPAAAGSIMLAGTVPAATTAASDCGQGFIGASVDALKAITQHGVRVAEQLAQLRVARQQLADLIVQHASAPMDKGSREVQAASYLKQVSRQHEQLSTALRTLFEAHDWLASTQALAAHLDTAMAELHQEERKGTGHQSSAEVLRLPCAPLQAQVEAAQVLSHSLQMQQQVSQARAASNAVGLLLSRAQHQAQGAAAQDMAADNSHARQELLQCLVAALQQLIARCTQLSKMLDTETDLMLKISDLQAKQQDGTQPADVASNSQLASLEARLQALRLSRQHAEKSIGPAKTLCSLQEQAIQLFDEHMATTTGEKRAELCQQQAELLEKVDAATDAMLKHDQDWAEADQALRFLDMADRYMELAESCHQQATLEKAHGLQHAAAEAQIAVLLQQELLQGLEQAAHRAATRYAPCAASQRLNIMDRPEWLNCPRKAATRNEHVLAAQAKLQQLKVEAAAASWHADAAHMQQVICGQAEPVFKQLGVLAKQAAQVQLQAAHKHAEQAHSPQKHSGSSDTTLQTASEAYSSAVLAADAAAQQLSQFEQGCCPVLHLHQQALKLEQACSKHTAAAHAWRTHQQKPVQTRPRTLSPVHPQPGSSLAVSPSSPAGAARSPGGDALLSGDVEKQLQRASQDAGHQLHILVDHTRALLNLHDAQDRVYRIILEMQRRGIAPAGQVALDAAGQLRLMALSTLSGASHGGVGSQAAEEEQSLQAALSHAKAVVEVQRANVQLALIRAFEYAELQASLAHKQISQRAAQLAGEAESAQHQVSQHHDRAQVNMPSWQLQEVLALNYTATRAHNRYQELTDEAGIQKAAAELADKYSSIMQEAQAATSSLQALITSINSTLHSPVAHQLLDSQVQITAQNTDSSAGSTAVVSADAGIDAAGAVSCSELIQRACGHVSAAMQQRLTAAGQVLQHFSCTVGIEQVSAAVDAFQSRSQPVGMMQQDTRQAQAVKTADCSQHNEEQEATIACAMHAAAAHQGLALLHGEALKLLQEQALLHSQALGPAEEQLARRKAAAVAAAAEQAPAQAAVLQVNQALDACQNNLQVASEERAPVYRARQAVLQVQLEAATKVLLAQEEQQAAAKQQLRAAQLQYDVVQAALKINAAAINQAWTALKWAAGSASKHLMSAGTKQPSQQPQTHMMNGKALSQLLAIHQAVHALQLSSTHIGACPDKSGTASRTAADTTQLSSSSQELQQLCCQAAGTLALAAHHGALLLEAEGQLARSQQQLSDLQDSRRTRPMQSDVVAQEQQLVSAIRKQVQLHTVKAQHLAQLVSQLHEQAGWVISCLQQHSAQQEQPQTEQGGVLHSSAKALAARFTVCQDLVAQLGPCWVETYMAADSAAAASVNSWLLARQAAADSACEGAGPAKHHSEIQSAGVAAQKHVDAAQASATQADALSQQAESIWEELQVQLEMAALQHAAASEAFRQLASSSLQDSDAALALEDTQAGLLPALSCLAESHDGIISGSAAEADSMAALPAPESVAASGQPEPVATQQVASVPEDDAGAADAVIDAPASGPAESSSQGCAMPGDQAEQAGTACSPIAAAGAAEGQGPAVMSLLEAELQTHMPAEAGDAGVEKADEAAERQLHGLWKSQPHPANTFAPYHNGSGSNFSHGQADSQTHAAKEDPTGMSGAPTVTKRTPLPPNMTPQQAGFLLKVWRERHRLASQASHITSQLREVASQQLREVEAEMASAHSSMQACITRGDPVGVAAATSTLNATRRQLHAAQQSSRNLNKQLGLAQQEAQDAGGMVERLWLHCGTQQTSPHVLKHALQGSAGHPAQPRNPDHRVGTLSPGAQTTLQRAAIAVQPDAGTRWDASSWRASQPEQQPWYISAAMYTGVHGATGMSALPSATVSQPDPSLQQMQQMVNASGMHVPDEETIYHLGGGPGMTSQAEVASVASRDCLLGGKRGGQWISAQSGVQAQVQCLERVLQQVKQEEEHCLAQAKQQAHKAEQAWVRRDSTSNLDIAASEGGDKLAVLSAQADRYNQASQAAARWAAQLGATRERLTLLQAELHSSVQALQHAQRDLNNAANTQLEGLQAQLEGYEMVCQALLLTVSRGDGSNGPDTWTHVLASQHGVLQQDLQDVDQAIGLLENTARGRSEVAVRFTQSCIEQGQQALDAYIQASVQVSGQLAKVSEALEQYAAQQAAQHNSKLQLEADFDEKASKSSRAALRSTAGGHAELGQKLVAAADGWRASAAAAHQEAMAAKRQAEELHLEAIQMQDASQKLQSQAAELKAHVNHVLDTEMRSMLATSRVLALNTCATKPTPHNSNISTSTDVPSTASQHHPLGSSFGRDHAVAPGMLHSSSTWGVQHTGMGASRKRALPGQLGCSMHVPGDGSLGRHGLGNSRVGGDVRYEPEERDAASARLLVLHDKLQRLEEQVHVNKRIAVANSQIHSCRADPSMAATGHAGATAALPGMLGSPAGRSSVATTCSPNCGEAELYARRAVTVAAAHAGAQMGLSCSSYDSPTRVSMFHTQKAGMQPTPLSPYGLDAQAEFAKGLAGQACSAASRLFR